MSAGSVAWQRIGIEASPRLWDPGLDSRFCLGERCVCGTHAAKHAIHSILLKISCNKLAIADSVRPAYAVFLAEKRRQWTIVGCVEVRFDCCRLEPHFGCYSLLSTPAITGLLSISLRMDILRRIAPGTLDFSTAARLIGL